MFKYYDVHKNNHVTLSWFRGSCLLVLFSHISCLYSVTTFRLCIIKSPFNNYALRCIAAAGNRASIPLENVVPHKV